MTQVRDRAAEAGQQEIEVIPPYSMRLVWDPDDAIFVVTVPELSGLMTHGATRAEAIERGENAIAMWLRAARHWGTPIPAPVVEGHIESGPSASQLSDQEQAAFRYMAQLLALRPDTANIPRWVRDDLIDFVGQLETLTIADFLALLASGGLTERTTQWLLDTANRAVVARRELTGEEPPPLPWLGQERRSG